MSHIARANLTLTNINIALMNEVMKSVARQRVAFGTHMELGAMPDPVPGLHNANWRFVVTPTQIETVGHASYWAGQSGNKACITMCFDRQNLRFEFDQDFRATAEAIRQMIQQTYVSAALRIALANKGFQVAESQTVEIEGQRHLVMRGVAA